MHRDWPAFPTTEVKDDNIDRADAAVAPQVTDGERAQREVELRLEGGAATLADDPQLAVTASGRQ